MFDNIIMTNFQRKALINNIEVLRRNNIHGKVILGNEFLNDTEDSIISGRIIYTAVVQDKDYIKAIEITDNPEIFNSLAAIEISHSLYEEGVIDDF